jgi:hypothetical protein
MPILGGDLKKAATKVIAWAVLVVLVGAFSVAWEHYKANRTALVRKVVMHPSDGNGPEIYMNDGTVWTVSQATTPFYDVITISGDKVRYVHISYSTEADCILQDVTIGRWYFANRISSPFTRSSCPAQ